MTDEETLWVGFTGSRDYPRSDLVESFVIATVRKYPNAGIVSGGRGNVDETAEKVGAHLGMPVISYRPREDGIDVVRFNPDSESTLHGFKTWVKNAFFRNEFIAAADRVVAFWDLESRGTADTISKARGKERPLFVYDTAGQLMPEYFVAQRLAEVLG